jgi:excisionase family DNA binding protein
MDRVFYSVAETCRLLSLGRTKVYELIGEERLAVVKIGRRSLVTAESIARLSGTAATESPE